MLPSLQQKLCSKAFQGLILGGSVVVFPARALGWMVLPDLTPKTGRRGGVILSPICSATHSERCIIEDVNVLWADYPRRDFGESQNIFWTPELLIIAGFALGFSKNHTIVKSKPSVEMGPKAQTALSSQFPSVLWLKPLDCTWDVAQI